MNRVPTEKEVRYETWGKFLQKNRMSANLTQRCVSKKLGYNSSQFISNWERGLSLPPQKNLPDIAQLYSISPISIIEVIDKYHDKVCARHKLLMAYIFETKSNPTDSHLTSGAGEFID